MNNKPLISIAIPTYNRANFLENLLNRIAPQAKESKGLVEICISNNCSTDNTREVIVNFREKYPSLINYSENRANLGLDRNLLKVMEMAQGDFVWLFGDDDMVVSNGIKKVIDFINNYCNKDTGLIMLGHRSHFIDNKTGKEMTVLDTTEKDKPKVYKINFKDIVGFPLFYSYISVLLFNNNFLKEALIHEKKIIEQAQGNHYIHVFIYNIMLLKHPELEIIRFNEIILDVGVSRYRFFIEDKFELYYAARMKLKNLLLSSGYASDYYKQIIINEKKKLRRGHIKEMGAMKAFGAFNYFSFFGCIKLFFKEAPFINALLFSVFFIIFYITPSFILKCLYKNFIRIKYKKKWRDIWFYTVITNSEMSKGTRRLIC